MSNLDHALAYAARGWRVIPVPPRGTFPAIQAWQNVATTDTDTITAWWTTNDGNRHSPDHGIGIATGKASGLWVFDVDTDRRRGKTGDETLADLEQAHGPLPDTYEVITGSGGRHLYFAWPDDPTIEIRNDQSGNIGKDLDVRADGGFVIAPPSVHKLYGTIYEIDAGAPDTLAHAPAWLLQAATKGPEGRRAPRGAPKVDDGGWIDVTPDKGERPGDLWADATDWAQILQPDGWTLHHEDRTGERHWTRPGKDHREGTSATTGYGSHDLLKVFTSSLVHMGLHAEATYSKLGYIAATRHDGDHGAAARHLRQQGWAAPTTPAPAIAPAAPVVLDDDGNAIDPWHAEQPIPVGAGAPLPPPPIDAYPAWIAAQIRNVTAQLDCDPMLPAVFALGALSVASLGHVNINVRSGETLKTTGLYLAAAGPPASGKSPALSMMIGPVREHEIRAITHATKAVAEAETRKRIAEKQAKEAADNAARTGEPERRDLAIKLAAEAELIDVPAHGELMTSDITPERLATLMADNAERIAIVSDESGVLNVDRYGDKSNGKKMDIYLQGFTGEPAVVHRQNAPTVRLVKPLLAMAVGVQPKALAEAMADKEFRDRGLASRFLTASTTRLANNTNIDVDVWNKAVGQDYHDRLTDLATRWASWERPAVLDIDPVARQVYSGWAAELRDREISGDLQGDGGWVSKMRSAVLRIAALFHLADGGSHDTPIGPQTLMDAIEIGEWFIAHHLHSVSASQGSDAERMIDWLRKHLERTSPTNTERGENRGLGAVSRATSLFVSRQNGISIHSMPRPDGTPTATASTGLFVSRRELGRSGPVGLRKIDDYAPVLEELDEAGWIRLVGVTVGNQNYSAQIRRAATIEVHPAILFRDTRDSATPLESHVIPHTVSDDVMETTNTEMHEGSTDVAESRLSLYRPLVSPSLSVVFSASDESPATDAIPRHETNLDTSHAEARGDADGDRFDLLADLEVQP